MSASMRGIERSSFDEQIGRVRRALLEGERQVWRAHRLSEQTLGVGEDAVVRRQECHRSSAPADRS